MTVRILTDSTCDLPEELRADAGVATVPLRLHFGDEEFRDRVDLEDQEFLRRLVVTKIFPRTSQPPPGDFEAAYRSLLVTPQDEVVSIHISAALSGTCGSAIVAAESVGSGRVHVVDSRAVSLGTGFQVLRAVELAQEGRSAAEIVRELAGMPDRTGIICLLDTVRYLQLGGRIGKVQAILGGALSIKPIVRLGNDGLVVPLGRVRSRAAGIRRLSEILVEHRPLARLGVIYVGASDAAAGLLADAKGTFPGMNILMQHASPVIGSHSGPGTLAYVYLEARP